MRCANEAMSRYTSGHFQTSDAGNVACLVLDVRSAFGPLVPDESGLAPVGTFARSLFRTPEGDHVGEIRFLVRGADVRLVAEYTGRTGVRECTPEALQAMGRDSEYHAAFCAYLGVEARGE